MSRSPSPSRSKIADDRDPSDPQITALSRTPNFSQYWFPRSGPVQSSVNQGLAELRFRPLHARLELLAGRADVLAHVRVHVGQHDVEVTVVVVVERLDAHRSPRRPGKHGSAPLLEILAADVLVVLVVALHVEHVEIGPPVPVDVDRARIAAPAHVDDPALFGHVDEAVVPPVLVEDAALVPLFRVQVSVEGVGEADMVAARADLVRGIPADVAYEEIEQPVAVVVEEDRPR